MKSRRSVPLGEIMRPVNLGDVGTVVGGQFKGLLRYRSDESRMISLLLQPEDFIVPAQLVGSADFRPIARVEWGSGGSTVITDIDMTQRRSVPFAAEYLDVGIWIAALPSPGTNVPIGPGMLGSLGPPGRADPGIMARVRASIAEGQQLDEFPGIWLTQFDANAGQFVIGQCRPLQLRTWAYANGEGSPQIYLLCFDKDSIPVNGDTPFDGTPLPLNIRQEITWPVCSRPFVHGFTWALSSTSDVLTLIPGALAFVTTEFRS